jgi:tRNA-dihydrouridine synthase B
MIASPGDDPSKRGQSLRKQAWDPGRRPVSMPLGRLRPLEMAGRRPSSPRIARGDHRHQSWAVRSRTVGELATPVLSADAKLPLGHRIIAGYRSRQVKVPVTLMMRMGWDHSSLNAPELARIAEDLGVRMITVHGRTRNQMYKGEADLALRPPRQGCGERARHRQRRHLLDRGCRGGARPIGRGRRDDRARRLRQSRGSRPGDALAAHRTSAFPTRAWKSNIASYQSSMTPCLNIMAASSALASPRKHIGWYTRGLHGSPSSATASTRKRTRSAAKAMLAEFYAPWLTRAAA